METNFIQWLPPYWREIVRPYYKFVIHVLTGQCEIERICNYDAARHTFKMTLALSSSIKHSKQLKNPQNLLFIHPYQHPKELYSVVSIYQEILEIKKMANLRPVISANVKTCIKDLRLVSAVKARLQEIRHTKFDYANADHIQLLERLWKALKPDTRRRENTLITPEWTELGFQNKDPSSDFRGMGLLGLIQLVYMAETIPEETIKLLHTSQFDATFFPFAATGINMTSYVLELLDKTHLHHYLLHQMDKILLQDTLNSIEGCSEDEKCVHFAVELIHQLYSRIFLWFGRLWLERKPINVMEFPKIFKELKKYVEYEYSPL